MIAMIGITSMSINVRGANASPKIGSMIIGLSVRGFSVGLNIRGSSDNLNVNN